MNKIHQKLLLLLFLLTGLINNSSANIIVNQTDSINNTKTFLEDEIKKFARDSIKISLDGKQTFLYGDAKIIYQNTSISAAYIEINWNTNSIYATTSIDSSGNKIGYPIFKEGNESFKANEITYNYKSKKSIVKQIVTKEGEGYILGKKVKKTEDDIFYLKKGDYTTCNAEHPHYSIRANKIKLIPGKKIITGPAYLSFFRVPTPLLLPFGFFPNNDKKSSGLIIPSYGESANQGFFLKDGGYYFSLNKKMDLALKSNIYTKGSWNIKSLLRYKNRYKYNGNINISYGNIINSEKGFPDYSVKKDFFIRWKHQQDQKANPSLNFSANVNAGSSTFHKNNSFNANDYLTNTFTSSINLSKSWDGTPFNFSSSINHNQNTRTKITNLTFPDIAFNVNRISPFKKLGKQGKSHWYHKIGLSYNVKAKNSISIADSLLFKQNSLSKFKNGMQHNIPISTSVKVLKHFTLTPRINFTERWYFSQINKEWDEESQSIITDTINNFTRGHNYSFSTGLNTKIYGLVQFKKSNLAAIRHVISPNLSFRYTPDFSSDKYGYYKTVQSDTEGNTQQYSIMSNGVYGSPSKGKNGNINFGLGNILEIKTRSKKDTSENLRKIKILESLNISSSYNIFKDSLNLNDISIKARTRLLDIFDINFTSNYDPYTSNKEQTKNINQFELYTNKRLARLTSFNTNIGFSLNDKSFRKKKKEEKSENKEDEKDEERDFYEIPWNINANYSLTYNKGFKSSAFADTIQSLNFSGNLKLTKKWKIGFRSGYDFDEKELSYTSVDIYRDLHCWEMLFNWIPLGNHRSYTLTIRVKAAALRDLKFEKKKDWYTPDFD